MFPKSILIHLIPARGVITFHAGSVNVPEKYANAPDTRKGYHYISCSEQSKM
jgi:hypothetical protein